MDKVKGFLEGMFYVVVFVCLVLSIFLPERARIRIGKWLLKIKHEGDA